LVSTSQLLNGKYLYIEEENILLGVGRFSSFEEHISYENLSLVKLRFGVYAIYTGIEQQGNVHFIFSKKENLALFEALSKRIPIETFRIKNTQTIGYMDKVNCLGMGVLLITLYAL